MHQESYQQDRYQVRVLGVGNADVLSIGRFHQRLGLSKQDCIRRILTAPSVLQSELDISSAEAMVNVLRGADLPCELVPQSEQLTPSQERFEIAVYITDFTHITSFITDLALFTGQGSEELLRCLVKTPAIILGNLSEKVAAELITRFSKPGIELIRSCSATARYTVVAYAPGGDQSLADYYRTFGLQRAGDQAEQTQCWQLTDLTLEKAQTLWQQANELHLPLVIHNQDYYRFDLLLKSVPLDAAARQQVSRVLAEALGIPQHLHLRLFEQLPMVLKRCIRINDYDSVLTSLAAQGCDVTAEWVGGFRFDLRFDTGEQRSRLEKLCAAIMGRPLTFTESGAGWSVKADANLHQGLWIQYEAAQSGIHCRLMRSGHE
ncbi:hypothetical protein [Amphritea pacifica]|uniref:Uncharacterized protein n=1 Tax=Amphritea pacifica TaxID=2811233 RepID=A0ABS2W6F1_9GAMM|nr:hypothetical protein [Amphritea pacifica]MBN0987286.1 hypothetical protein [Amphritea pacifica]MBN1005776.1 hypothetical protein [Amphritea pacifica]